MYSVVPHTPSVCRQNPQVQSPTAAAAAAAAAAAVVILTLTRIVKSVVTGQSSVILEWKNIPGKKKQAVSGTRIGLD